MSLQLPIGINEIVARLPHRYPILLVDRVDEVELGTRLVAVKNVTINEDYFRGHFPGNPIMPGVLIVEALAQAAGLLVSLTEESRHVLLPYLVGMDGVRFRRPVVPGDQLRLEVEVSRRFGSFWRFRGQATVDHARASEANLLVSVSEKSGDKR